MNTFIEQSRLIFKTIGAHKLMVLSTSYNDKVTSRMMSVIIDNGCFYFQTGNNSRKYEQLINNRYVSLCTDNIQIEGACYEIGHPSKNTSFCRLYKEYFKSAYDKYTCLENERLFKVFPYYIQTWIYEDGKPFIESFDFNKRIYQKTEVSN